MHQRSGGDENQVVNVRPVNYLVVSSSTIRSLLLEEHFANIMDFTLLDPSAVQTNSHISSSS